MSDLEFQNKNQSAVLSYLVTMAFALKKLILCAVQQFDCQKNEGLHMRGQKSFTRALLKATQMTGMGHLMDATRRLQRALLKTVPRAVVKPQPTAPVRRDMSKAAIKDTVIYMPPPADVEPTAPARTPAKATFTECFFSFEDKQFSYRLYTPVARVASDSAVRPLLPLIVLLHGCKQNAQDFALGTAMNELAEQQGCMVLYPEQLSSANAQRCWNWFEPGHQQRGRGEPGMIVALTQRVLAAHQGAGGADPERVYIAGLSAGGAMAAVVAGLCPDIFAGLGVHSGLPAGAAKNLISAFSAMRRGAKGHNAPALPTIVFHGDHDKTVHPDNGKYISSAALAALKSSGVSLAKSSAVVTAADGQTTERTIYRAANGPSYIEHWRVDNGPHAWSGGNSAGSFTNPAGPSASAAMLTFFLQHSKT